MAPVVVVVLLLMDKPVIDKLASAVVPPVTPYPIAPEVPPFKVKPWTPAVAALSDSGKSWKIGGAARRPADHAAS